MIWASSHIENFRDWDSFIIAAVRAGRLRSSGTDVEHLTWEYRTTHIHGTWSGHDVTTEWRRSDQLDHILQASARAMVATSEQQIAQQATQPGVLSVGDVVSRGGSYRSPGLFERKPRAVGRRRFRHGTTEPRLYTLAHQQTRTGYSPDAQFYVFEPQAAQGEGVPEDYVVVGGADYNTYTEIYETANIVVWRNADGYGGHLDVSLRPNTEEVLLAKIEDLEEVR
jgi:hypothetical protein